MAAGGCAAPAMRGGPLPTTPGGLPGSRAAQKVRHLTDMELRLGLNIKCITGNGANLSPVRLPEYKTLWFFEDSRKLRNKSFESIFGLKNRAKDLIALFVLARAVTHRIVSRISSE